MKMNGTLLKTALTRIARRKGDAAKIPLGSLIEFFSGEAIVVPNPKYGNIVYDVEPDYCYRPIKVIMDRRREAILRLFEENMSVFYQHPFLDSVPDRQRDRHGYYWKNGFFSEGDGRTLYAMLAHHKPARMLEMGVGNSTKMARKAIKDFDLPTEIVSIDPSPRADIRDVTDRHIQGSITSVELDFFEDLKPGDFLFIDGSHICHCGTDVPYYALNILSILKSGVYVHIHDITLPWEYSEEFRIRHYNEQYIVGAIIACEANWEITFPVNYAFREGIIPHRGGSLWLKKK